jgi:glycosyltransferase involved in cell wall biosynthesis
MLASQLTGVPFSISIHGPHIFFEGFSWALDRKAELASFIACIGHFCVSQMMLYAGAQHFDKFRIVRCGIRPAEFPYRPPGGEVRKLLFVGRLSGEKGLPFLLRAVAELNRQGHELEIELMGDGEERPALEALAAELGIAGRVRFRGFVDRDTIISGLAASDLFILPSFAEGIPVALMEAMAIGVPVIATRVGGVSELVIDGETGRTVAPASADALSEAILSYIENPALCADISRRARAKVEADFDIDEQVSRLESLFLGAASAAEHEK